MSANVNVLQLLGQFQTKYPTLRTCQVISNAMSHYGYGNPDLYYVDDSQLEKALKEYLDYMDEATTYIPTL